MGVNMEIERKFLVEFPDLNKLSIVRKISILQTYLENDENENQRRVRIIDDNGEISYTYTEKTFLTRVTRREMEYNINEQEYQRLVLQARKDTKPVEKVRYVFEYKNQFFELDTYPFSDRLAILELELNDAEQQIFFPEYVKVIKEVSEDRNYSNAALASAGAFPE